MITTRDYLKKHSLAYAEVVALLPMVDNAVEAMRAKLLKKWDEGSYGWDCKNFKKAIDENILRHVNKGLDDPDNLIDIMNLCAIKRNMLI